MKITINGSGLIFCRHDEQSGKVTFYHKYKQFRKGAPMITFPWSGRYENNMTDAYADETLVKLGLDVPITRQAEPVREPGTVGIAMTKTMLFMTYTVDKDGKIRNIGVHTDRHNANKRAFMMAAMQCFYNMYGAEAAA